MLQAIKTGTLTELQVRTLNIRQSRLTTSERELKYWTTTFSTMATMSALIAGFTYGGLTVNIPKGTSTFLTLGYLSTTTLSMCFSLLTIIISTFCNMFGPGLALRGGEGSHSVHKAIQHLKGESKKSFKFFMTSLCFFHISSFLLMWLIYTWLVSLIINVVLLIFLVLFLQNGFSIVQDLYIPEESAVTSKFDNFNVNQNSPKRQQHLAPGMPQQQYYGGRGTAEGALSFSGSEGRSRVEINTNPDQFQAEGAGMAHVQKKEEGITMNRMWDVLKKINS